MNKQIEALKMAIEWMKDEPNLDYQFYFDTIQACEEAIAEAEKQDDIEKQLDYAHARGFKEGAENAYKKMEQPVCSKCGKPTQQGECFYGCRQEQPAQEPVALIRHENGNFSPAPSWQGLSDDDAIMKLAEYHGVDSLYETGVLDFIRAIEQALKEKNHAER